MPARAQASTAAARQQTPDLLPSADLQEIPDLQGPMNPALMFQLQGLMGNSAMGQMMPGAEEDGGGQGGADPDALFDAGEGAQRAELPARAKLEAAFGTDLSHVEVHKGPEAEAALGGLNAKSAYRDGVILLGKDAGPEEAAHEVLHQQQEENGASGGAAVDSGAGQAAESEAHEKAKKAAAGEPVEVEQSPDAGIQRWGLGDLWDGVKEAGKGAWNTASNAVTGVADTVTTAASSAWDTTKTFASGVADTAMTAGGAVVDTVGAAASGAWDTVKAAGGGIVDTVSAAGSGIADTASSAWGGITDTAGAAWGGLTDVWNARGDGIGGMLSAAGGGLMDTLGAAGGGVMDTLSSAGGGLMDTLGAAGGGLLDTVSAAGGGIWDTLSTAGGGLWDTLSSAGSTLWDTGASALRGVGSTLDAAIEGGARTGASVIAGLYNSAKGFLPDSWFDALDSWVQNKGGTEDASDSDSRFYSTAPRSTVDNKYTQGMDIPQNLTGMDPEFEGDPGTFTQQFSPLGLPLTQEAWDYQNRIDGGKLQQVHHTTLLGTLQSEGVLDELVASGEFDEDELTQDFSQMSREDLHELVVRVDNAGATQQFFAGMDAQTWTNLQEGVLDTYIEMANSDPKNAAFFLDILPTELDINLSPSELMKDGGPNDFRAGSTVSLLREGTATAADNEAFEGMDRYGLVVPFSNTPENVVRRDGVPTDGVDHLSNYLQQIDPEVTTLANTYSQSGTVGLNYAQQHGGTEGLDYLVATAPMGGPDQAGSDGVWAGSISQGVDDPGVQTLSISHQDDPARYINEESFGFTGLWWGMGNFTFADMIPGVDVQKGDGQLHGGFPDESARDPQNGTNGYPMTDVYPWIDQLFNGDFQGQDYDRRQDWDGYDRRDQEAAS